MTDELAIPLPGHVTAVQVLSSDAAPEAPQAEAVLQMHCQELAQARGALLEAARRVADVEAEIRNQAEGQLVDLALAIATKALMQEIEQGRYRIEPIVREALAAAPPRREVTVRLHPDDLAACEMLDEDGPSDHGGAVRFVADASVRRADCRVECAEGVVASEIEANLQAIGQALSPQE